MSAATYARDAEFHAWLVAPKPFVKWAGGKRQLLPELFKHVPPKFGRYFEPFVGGGALFFALAAQGGIDATLGDATAPLILTYKACASDVDGLVEALEWHAARYSEEHYYATREAFNRAGGRVGVAGAARFVYLNRTGFNGLWRVNRDGGFNVPFGDYKNPTS